MSTDCYSLSHESLEHANAWLTKRLQMTEQQVVEGEEVNMNLTEENRLLKEKKKELMLRVDELTGLMDDLKGSMTDYTSEKESLQQTIASLEATVSEYRSEEEYARINSQELKYEMERAQEVINKYTDEMMEMKAYIERLEENNANLIHNQESAKEQHGLELHLLDQEIFDLKRKISDMESLYSTSQHQLTGESGDLILQYANGGGDSPLCKSSPLTIGVLNGEDVKLPSSRSVTPDHVEDLERRLESVQIANEIYQDEVSDLKLRLDNAASGVCNGCHKETHDRDVQSSESQTEMFFAKTESTVETQTVVHSQIHVCTQTFDLQSSDIDNTNTLSSESGVCPFAANSELKNVGIQVDPSSPEVVQFIRVDSWTQYEPYDNDMNASGSDGRMSLDDCGQNAANVENLCPSCKLQSSLKPHEIPQYSDAVVECQLLDVEDRPLSLCDALTQTERFQLSVSGTISTQDSQCQTDGTEEVGHCCSRNQGLADMICDIKQTIDAQKPLRKYVVDFFKMVLISMLFFISLISLLTLFSDTGSEIRRVLLRPRYRPSIPPH